MSDNRSGWVQRQVARKREERRNAARSSLTNPAGVLLFCVGRLDEEDLSDFQFGEGHAIERVARLINSDPALHLDPTLPNVPEAGKRKVGAPLRQLCAAKRGGSQCRFGGPPLDYPGGFLPAPVIDAYFRQAEVLATYRRGCRFRALETAKKMLACLNWPDTAAFLAARGLVDRPFSTAEVESVRRAVLFETVFFKEARDRYAAMLPVYRLERACGDWGAWTPGDLRRFRPELDIPFRVRKQLYLTERIVEPCGGTTHLHFYSIRYHPLFRLPLVPTRRVKGRDQPIPP
jgi:hypothetical protein